jgi:inner membrane protein involved in colicin E2 resistance
MLLYLRVKGLGKNKTYQQTERAIGYAIKAIDTSTATGKFLLSLLGAGAVRMGPSD